MNYSVSTINCQVNEHGVAVLKMNRPNAMNALNKEMRMALLEILSKLEDDNKVKVIIITGEGKAFSSGGDIREMDYSQTSMKSRDKLRDVFHKIIVKLYNMEKPVIMAVNGFAFGAGCNLALCGDIILASDKAKFSQAFLNVGLVPDGGGFYFLPRLIGLPRAKEMVFSRKVYSAEEVEKIGLVNHVIEDKLLMIEAIEMANHIAQGPSKAMGMAKTMLNQGYEVDLNKSLEFEAMAQAIAMGSEDHIEGVNAFLEKRKPNFKGF